MTPVADPATDPDPLVQRIREFMAKHGMSAGRFARHAGVTQPSITEALAGRRHIGPMNRAKIVEALERKPI